MDAKELAIALARAEKEADVIAILQQKNLWNDFACWRPFGDNDNNYSTIGNQQSKPDAALVEKLINSVDAILMKECMARGIDMTSPAAPQSISDALSTFFGIREGQIAYLDTAQRNAMSKDILVAATGMRRGAMNLIIADKGEGQTPKRMPETILSISKNNKLRVPFVQGKFNMGGTGVLPFCGENRFQLVISKRCPSIPNDCQDETFNSWSVTIVRREEAREGRRSTMFTYLTDPNGNVLSFEADSLPIIPLAQGKGYEDMPFGTFFKLYNYAIQGYKSNILMDFNYRLSMLMPDLAHPIRLRECRDYEGHSFETTLSGLHTRLFDDRENNIEEGFPASSTFNVDGQSFKCSIYVFKAGKSKNYREDDGILYTINGQTHACISQTFFNKVNLSYLADSLLVLVDCSAIDVTHREDMFMNSRDRLRDGAFVRAVQDRIKEILKEHQGLKKLQNERRAQAVQNRLNDDRPLQNVLNNILAKSPVLSKILLTGSRLTNPFNTSSNGGNGEDFVGKMHPTFFKLREKHREEILVKHVPINHAFRVQFDTDVENSYFSRATEPGSFVLKMDGVERADLIRHLGLFNGTATLTIVLPEGIKEGDQHTFSTLIDDACIPQEYPNTFKIVAEKEKEYTGGGTSPRTPPPGNNPPRNRTTSDSGVGMPNILEKTRADWDEFQMDDTSALVLRATDDSSDYFLNMDNKYLLTELKGMRDANKIKLTKARYKYSMALIGMSVQSYYKSQSEQGTDITVEDEVRKISTMLAPILIPMLDAMSDLDMDEIGATA